jgi:hypothetical protein
MLNDSCLTLTKGLSGLVLLIGCSVASQGSPRVLCTPAVPTVPAQASANVEATTAPVVGPSVSVPPRLVLPPRGFPKLLPELQPVLPVLATGLNGPEPPRLVLPPRGFPKLLPEQQPVLPGRSAPDHR